MGLDLLEVPMKSELFYSSVDKCCQVLSQPLADQNRAVSDFSGAINISGQGDYMLEIDILRDSSKEFGCP